MVRRFSFIGVLVLLGFLLFLNPNLKTILAGVAILLFGMMMLEEGFRVFAKGPLRKILKKATNKMYKSISVGAMVTAFIQSSSLVTVITISFISAGLIDFVGGLGLIFGANIGTTATAWLVAAFGLKIKISALALPMLVFGIVFSFQKRIEFKGIGNVLAGLGFFFLGIHYMKEGFDVFKQHIDLTQYAISGFLGVVVYTGIGIIITTILQSSSATLALILTALSVGQINYENALAIAIGANVGTTITAVLGSLGSNVAGKRLAGAHAIFNIFTGIIALIFIYPLANLVALLSDLFHISARDYTLKLAMFHTVFNILGVLLMIPFVRKIERILLWFFKEKTNKDIDEPKYLNEAVLEFPSSVISSLIKESQYLYKEAIFEIVAHALNIHRGDIKSNKKVKTIVKKSQEELHIDVDDIYYKKVKTIYGEIIRYASMAESRLKLQKKQQKTISDIRVANRKMIEIIKYVKELNRNINLTSEHDNKYMQKEYDGFRKKLIKVLRVIYLFRTEEDPLKYSGALSQLKKEAKENIRSSNKSIDRLIRKDLITAKMASSLFNDYTNMNQITKNLIEVAELLYYQKDTLLDDNKKMGENKLKAK